MKNGLYAKILKSGKQDIVASEKLGKGDRRTGSVLDTLTLKNWRSTSLSLWRRESWRCGCGVTHSYTPVKGTIKLLPGVQGGKKPRWAGVGFCCQSNHREMKPWSEGEKNKFQTTGRIFGRSTHPCGAFGWQHNVIVRQRAGLQGPAEGISSHFLTHLGPQEVPGREKEKGWGPENLLGGQVDTLNSKGM